MKQMKNENINIYDWIIKGVKLSNSCLNNTENFN